MVNMAEFGVLRRIGDNSYMILSSNHIIFKGFDG